MFTVSVGVFYWFQKYRTIDNDEVLLGTSWGAHFLDNAITTVIIVYICLQYTTVSWSWIGLERAVLIVSLLREEMILCICVERSIHLDSFEQNKFCMGRAARAWTYGAYQPYVFLNTNV